MAETSYPFDAGPGAAVTEDQWRRMARAWRPSGVIGNKSTAGLVVTPGTGAALSLTVGEAWVDGFYYRNDADLMVNVPANTDPNPRINLAVLRLDPVANTVTTQIVQGTPAASPVAPALTQSDTGVWEEPVAEFTMPQSSLPQNPTSVVDRRRIVPSSGAPTTENMYSTFNQGQYVGLPATTLAITSGQITPPRDGVIELDFNAQLVCPGNGAANIGLVIQSVAARTLTFHSQSQAGESSVSGRLRGNVQAGEQVTWYVSGNSAANGVTVILGAMNISIDLLS